MLDSRRSTSDHPHQFPHRERALFYRCNLCGNEWPTVDGFLDDAYVVLEGVHTRPDSPAEGIMYFTHQRDGCGTTFGLKTGNFISIVPPCPYTVDLSQTRYCPGQCFRPKDFTSCGRPCLSLWVREVIVAICTRHYDAVHKDDEK